MAKQSNILEMFHPLREHGLEQDIEQFSVLTGLPQETYPIQFMFDIDNTYEQYKKGDNAQVEAAKLKLGQQLHNDKSHYLSQEGLAELVENKNALDENYKKQVFPLIHQQYGKAVVDSALAPINHLQLEYEKLKREKDENKIAEGEAKLDNLALNIILKMYGPLLNNEHIKNLNKLIEAREKGGTKVLESVVRETSKDLYNPFFLKSSIDYILRDPKKMDKFIQRYQDITLRKLLKEYKTEKGINVEKLGNDVYSSLANNPKGYEILVNQMYGAAKEAQRAEEARRIAT